MNRIFLLILFFTCSKGLVGQEEKLEGLKNNPVLESLKRQGKLNIHSSNRQSTITLPFFDDFNYPGPYPDNTLWEDNFTYINSTYPVRPVTIGVATFDGLNALGEAYSDFFITGTADYLTSQKIDLSNLTADSSVFLSFFFQAEGFGDQPELNIDSLKVEFKDTSGTWIKQWSYTIDSLAEFQQVFLHVNNAFLTDSFQFRFVNIGRLSGNNDHWHIDYVQLDKDRDTTADQFLKDMAYQYPPSSLLERYYVMPYFQFDTSELADFFNTYVRNNFTNLTTDFLDSYTAIEPVSNTIVNNFIGSSIDLSPLTNNTITYSKFDIPDNFPGDTVTIRLNFNFQVSAESGSAPKILGNDSLVKDQVFGNFFAYDDGSAEKAYLMKDATGARVAMKYHANKEDTLQGIKIHFANMNTNDNLALFSIIVWKSLESDSTVEDTLYTEDFLKMNDLHKENATDAINDFSYYDLKSTFIKAGGTKLLVDGDFYIGLQVTTSDVLNIGFDVNTDGSANHFYNTGNGWRNTQYSGSLMINPLMGKPLPWELTPVINHTKQEINVQVYPNPAKDKLYVKGFENRILATVYDISGQMILEQTMESNEAINVANLSSGMYILMVTDSKTGTSGTGKWFKY